MSSFSKGESMSTKLVKLFTNMVVERRNMIKVYLRGRPGAEDWEWSHRLSTQWPGGAVWGLHRARRDEKHEFLD
jgi:hypothetical protein